MPLNVPELLCRYTVVDFGRDSQRVLQEDPYSLLLKMAT